MYNNEDGEHSLCSLSERSLYYQRKTLSLKELKHKIMEKKEFFNNTKES